MSYAFDGDHSVWFVEWIKPTPFHELGWYVWKIGLRDHLGPYVGPFDTREEAQAAAELLL